MNRRLPLIPTLMTLVMVGTMIWLGFWQLQRREWKHRLIASLEAAEHLPPATPSDFYRAMIGAGSVQYRRAVVACHPGRVTPYDVRGGESATGQSGFLIVVACREPAYTHKKGPDLVVVAGFSDRPELRAPLIVDTEFDGTIIERPYDKQPGRPLFMLIPKTAVPPLTPSRLPSPEDLPDSHLSYAIQWFSFATILAVIYAIFVFRRQRDQRATGVMV
ncbi:SURF1 family protein [Sphingosinicellaceae bacterium]|nr:SURF1 family protein [Sphingosinicellaceae bacterium]